MQSYTRHQLKEDKFATSAKEAAHWTVEHRSTLINAAVLVAVVLAVVGGYVWYTTSQDEKASIALGEAMRTYTAPVRPADAPPVPGVTSFPTAAERSKAAHDQFLKIATSFPGSRNGKYALYMTGIAAMDMGDNAMAEKHLKEAAQSGNAVVTPLAKFALGSLYHNMQEDEEAAKIYREVAALGSDVVPKVTAQLTLAEMYAAKQPADAIKIYEQIQKDEQEARKLEVAKTDKGKEKGKDNGSAPALAADSPTPLEQLATARIAALKSGQNK